MRDNLLGVSEPTQQRKSGRGWKILLGVIIGLILIAVVGYGIDYFGNRDKVARGTSVGGVEIGGLTPAEAEEKLRAELGGVETRPVTVTAGEQDAVLIPADSGLGIDWETTVAQVGEESANPVTRLRGLLSNNEIPVVSTVDEAALAPQLDRVTGELSTAPADASLSLVDGNVEINDAVLGQTVERGALSAAVRDGWLNPEGVAVEPQPVEPAITQEIAESIADGPAKKALSGPLTVHGDGADATIEPAQIGEVVTFRNDPAAATIHVEVRPEPAQALLEEQLAGTETEAENAQISTSGAITPHVDGRVVDWEATMADFPARVLGDQPREWDATYTEEPATFTTTDAENATFTEVMGEFTTSGYSPTSGENIAVIAADLNGVIVSPGNTFSVNQFTGPRGTAQGYVEGGTIENGRAGRAVGGGISQFATTLYNATYFAGLEDVTHTPHSYYISRYPAGREATIYDGAIDLAFRNQTNVPIRIETSVGGGNVTVRIMGTKLYNVESVSGGRWAPTKPKELELSGEDCIPSGGIDGFTTSDTRIVRDLAGNEVFRETQTTVYDPQPIVRCS